MRTKVLGLGMERVRDMKVVMGFVLDAFGRLLVDCFVRFEGTSCAVSGIDLSEPFRSDFGPLVRYKIA